MHRLAASGLCCRPVNISCVYVYVCECVYYLIHILVGQIHFHSGAVVTPFTHLLLALLWTALCPWREVAGLSALPKGTPVGHMGNFLNQLRKWLKLLQFHMWHFELFCLTWSGMNDFKQSNKSVKVNPLYSSSTVDTN